MKLAPWNSLWCLLVGAEQSWMKRHVHPFGQWALVLAVLLSPTASPFTFGLLLKRPSRSFSLLSVNTSFPLPFPPPSLAVTASVKTLLHTPWGFHLNPCWGFYCLTISGYSLCFLLAAKEGSLPLSNPTSHPATTAQPESMREIQGRKWLHLSIEMFCRCSQLRQRACRRLYIFYMRNIYT